MNNPYLWAVMATLALVLSGCHVNKNIVVPPGAHRSGNDSTVNGEIAVGTHAVVRGNLRTINGQIAVAVGAKTGNLTVINGSIRLGKKAKSADLQTVNGNIALGAHARTTGSVATVNGSIYAGKGARIGGDASAVNGNITICSAQIDGNVSFYNGTVLITDGSAVRGHVTVKRPRGVATGYRTPIVVIGPRTRIDHRIMFDRPGKLYVSDRAIVHGIDHATVISFSGALPKGPRVTRCAAGR